MSRDQGSLTDFSNFNAPTVVSSSALKPVGTRTISTIDDGLYDGNKSLKLLYLNATSLVVIVDDKADVWGEDGKVSVTTKPSAADNLLLVKPYLFFKGDVQEIYNRDSNRNSQVNQESPGSSASTAADADAAPVQEVKENDDILVRYCSLLKSIHSQVFTTGSTSSSTGTVPAVIKSIKSGVLRGCCISFSGVIPRRGKGAGADDASFIGHPLYKLACSLGATVLDDFTADGYSGSGNDSSDTQITHLICNKAPDKLRTTKYFHCINNYDCNGVAVTGTGIHANAKGTVVHLVSVEWLASCRHYCEHVSETAFHVPLLKAPAGSGWSGGERTVTVDSISNLKKRKYEERVEVEVEATSPVVLVPASSADGGSGADSDSDDFDDWADEL